MSEFLQTNQPQVAPPESPPPQPVLTLRQARERAGLHLVALAATLKVPVHRLEALEAGRYEALPDMTFARALALSVCRVLKVDAAPILASFPASGVVRLGEPEHALNAPMPLRSAPAVGPAAGSGAQSVPLPLAFALVVLVVAVVLWFVLPASSDGVVTARAPLPPVAAVPAANPEPSVLPSSVPSVSGPAIAAAEPTVTVGPSMTDSTSVQGTEAVSALVPAASLPTDGLLQVRVQETAWIQVTGASGRVLVQRELKAGESVGFSSDLPLAVVLGRADVVQVNVRGQALDLAPHTRSNVARFEVR